MSLALVHKNGIRWRLVFKRLVKIGGWAMVITLVTYVLFPKNYIFFGVLHCIALASVAGVFFINRPRLSLFLCLLLVIPNMILQPKLLPVTEWLDVAPLDYVPLYPWFGIVLLGIYLESRHFHEILLGRNHVTICLEFVGCHSLTIYLLHRPLLYGTFFFLYKVKTGQ
jgi:uncharacterized membrane protein